MTDATQTNSITSQSIPSKSTHCTSTIQSVQVAKATGVDGTQRPLDGWQTVTLPDHWENRWSSYSGSAWYKINWNYHCNSNQQLPVTLVINNINMAGQMYINQHWLWQDQSLVEPLSRSWNMPRYWNFPTAVLQTGQNTLWIRVIGVKYQNSGLGTVILDQPSVAVPQFESFWLKQRVLNFFNLTFSFTLACITFLVWAFYPKDSAFGWFALACFLWVLVMTNVVMINPILGFNTLQVSRINIFILFSYSVCSCLYSWRFAGVSHPRIEKTMFTACVVVAMLALFIPEALLGTFLLVTFLLAVLIVISNCIYFPFIAYKVKQTESYLLAGIFIGFLFIVIHDSYYIISNSNSGMSLTAYTALISTLFITIVLAMRLTKNIKKIERFNHTLEQNISDAKADLSYSLNTQHQLELQNTKLQERLNLAHDLHDGLGGSLVRAIVTVEQSNQAVNKQQFLSILKLLRSDLRQVIDSGSSIGAKIPDTPVLWAAPLRHSFIQIFDELDIHSTWSFPQQWDAQPSAIQCLAMSRVMEEALTNVIKHSQATSVSVKLSQRELRPEHQENSHSSELPLAHVLELEIIDNGIGFDVEEVIHQAGISVGMQSMQIRINRVGGKLTILSNRGHTRLEVLLPVKLPVKIKA